MTSKPSQVGFVIGALLSVWHILWALLVLLGWAQPLLDFIFWAHMIQPIYQVKTFDPRAAITLIIITFGIGYTFGFVGAKFWNRVAGKS